jgi:hypothetical protein
MTVGIYRGKANAAERYVRVRASRSTYRALNTLFRINSSIELMIHYVSSIIKHFLGTLSGIYCLNYACETVRSGSRIQFRKERIAKSQFGASLVFYQAKYYSYKYRPATACGHIKG